MFDEVDSYRTVSFKEKLLSTKDTIDNILCAQDVGRGTILVLLDFSRAFNTINRKLVVAKILRNQR